MKSKTIAVSRPRPIWLFGVLLILAMLLAACQPASTPTAMPAPTNTPAPTATEVAMSAAEISVANDATLGSILVGADGMTLYMFTKDGPDQSNCDAGCLANWPPLVTEGDPTVGDGVDASLVGTASLADGRKIVTYNHMPLYYWVNDKQAGDTSGQGVGSVWFVVSPDGQAVGMEPAMSAAEISVANDATLGSILVGADGMTLYMFANDGPDQSNCDAACLEKWPPLVTEGDPTAGDGVDASLVGTASLADGRKIVTYNHMPLYYWANDEKAGDTTGQGVGSVWFVVSPDGKSVGMETPAMDDSSAAMANEAVLGVADDATLGLILVGADGMTLYIFTNDGPDQSNCDAACLEKWPPLVTEGKPTVGDGVDDSLVGTASLADGRMIVTYNHMPLYYWANDKQAGDTTGQGVGSVWYVISPDGKVVGNGASAY